MPYLPTFLYAAFPATPFGGNIGGVVFEDEPLTPEQRQGIAADLAAPTTGFVTLCEDASFRTRFHSSRSETAMCGHVTVAMWSSPGFVDGYGFVDFSPSAAALS
ncbi:MAG: PhzF family phenazine biosynthesis protein [Pseudomonadota bacterium]